MSTLFKVLAFLLIFVVIVIPGYGLIWVSHKLRKMLGEK